MGDADSIPKLQMAPRLSSEQLADRYRREQRLVENARERALDGSLEGFRVGSVRYLNAAPLTRGIEDEIIFDTPRRLAERLRSNELDAGLVSVVEALFNEGYKVLDGVGVCSLGEVYSVVLVHRIPLEDITTIHCDTASLTVSNSCNSFGRKGISASFEPLDSYDSVDAHEAVLLIGNPAIDFRRKQAGELKIWDLGAAWYDLTALPFVYAMWVLKPKRIYRDCVDSYGSEKFGVDTLDQVIRSRTEYDRDFRQDYLGISTTMWPVMNVEVWRVCGALEETFEEQVLNPSFELRLSWYDLRSILGQVKNEGPDW